MLPPDAAASTTGPRPLSAAASSATVPVRATATTAGQRAGNAAGDAADAAATALLAKPIAEDASDGQPLDALGGNEVAVGEPIGGARVTYDTQPPPSNATGVTAGGQATASEPPQPNASEPEGDEAAGHGRGAAPADADAQAESQHSGEVQRGLSATPAFTGLPVQADTCPLLDQTAPVQASGSAVDATFQQNGCVLPRHPSETQANVALPRDHLPECRAMPR